MQHSGQRISQHPVTHRKFSGIGARRQIYVELIGADKTSQSGAMHPVDPQSRKLGFVIRKLVLEKAVPAELAQKTGVLSHHALTRNSST